MLTRDRPSNLPHFGAILPRYISVVFTCQVDEAQSVLHTNLCAKILGKMRKPLQDFVSALRRGESRYPPLDLG